MGNLSTRTGSFETKETRKLAWVFVSLIACGSPTSFASNASVHPSLCNLNEVVLATCPLRRKLASICGQINRATYRFGRRGQIELVVNVSHYTSQMFSSGGESQIVAVSYAYQYVIYDRAIRKGLDKEGHNPLVFTSGLMVLRNGRLLSDFKCGPLDRDVIDTNQAINFMPTGKFVWRDSYAHP